MQTFRIYPIGLSGQIGGPPKVISAESDAEAWRHSVATVTAESGAEVWQGVRMLGRLPPNGSPPDPVA